MIAFVTILATVSHYTGLSEINSSRFGFIAVILEAHHLGLMPYYTKTLLLTTKMYATVSFVMTKHFDSCAGQKQNSYAWFFTGKKCAKSGIIARKSPAGWLPFSRIITIHITDDETIFLVSLSIVNASQLHCYPARPREKSSLQLKPFIAAKCFGSFTPNAREFPNYGEAPQIDGNRN